VKYNKFVNSAFLYLTEALLLRSTTLWSTVRPTTAVISVLDLEVSSI
jgi:hypothetical protein